MRTWVEKERTVASQKVEHFTGEGGYHGSTKQKTPMSDRPVRPCTVAEARPTTVEQYLQEGRLTIDSFEAQFPNLYDFREQMIVPNEEHVRRDRVTFCWCPFEEALTVAGPLTREVLYAMRPHLSGTKKHAYVDSKIQYFMRGDLPVDSLLWHVDGSIAVRDNRAQKLGHSTLHDMRARFAHDDPPIYLAYQSSWHSSTEFLNAPLGLEMPELIPNFDGLDQLVRDTGVIGVHQPPASIVRFDGLSLHRAVPAAGKGWRLWIRVTETDRKIVVDDSVINCYGKTFRPE